ncbi:MAG: outer membrane protein assembly factor BamC [Burkholderiales bacterium]|nr:outer membrane protein assembly factor BamC [Burkholderiales bacterium]
MKTSLKNTGLLLSTVLLYACGTTDSQAVFTSAAPRETTSLATPPGLNSPEISGTYKMNPANQMQANYQVDKVKDMYIANGGSQRWLVMESTNVDNVWPMLTAYVNQIGLSIKYQNPSIGVVQTDWAARNTSVPQGDSVRGIFDWIGWGSMYSLNSMYMYRVTLWQDGNNVVVMNTNYQMDEEYEGCSSPGLAMQNTRISSEGQRTKWIARGSSPQLELEFLAQFMSFAGAPADQVKEIVKTQKQEVVKNAVYKDDSVIVNDSFDRTWWRAAIALERINLGVLDKNRALGEYDVYPLLSSVDNPDPGVLSKWFGNESANIEKEIKAKYKVLLTTRNNQTIITLLPYDNSSKDQSFTEERKKYLTGLAEQLQ